jgi:hypothetical protein
MKLIMSLSLICFSLVFHGASAFASNQLASVLGRYEKASAVRTFESQESCKEMSGEFMPDDGACIVSYAGGNSIVISKSSINDEHDIVEVSTVFGAIHQRSFEGLVIKSKSGQMIAVEINPDTEKPLKRACVLAVVVDGGSASVLPSGKFCDRGLHIENAKKMN